MLISKGKMGAAAIFLHSLLWEALSSPILHAPAGYDGQHNQFLCLS